jgi:CheY-like chemotaxis protein
MSNKKPIVVRRVLVIDDAQDVADITVELLRSMGHVAEAVYNSKDGVSSALRFQPDVVLVDLVMPEVDGFRLVRELRAMFPAKTPKLVAFTAHKQKSFLDAADSAGFDAHITKPVSEDSLAAVLAP